MFYFHDYEYRVLLQKAKVDRSRWYTLFKYLNAYGANTFQIYWVLKNNVI